MQSLACEQRGNAACRARCLQSVARPCDERPGAAEHRRRAEQRAHGTGDDRRRVGEREKLRTAYCGPCHQRARECHGGSGETQTERLSVTHSDLLVFSFGPVKKFMLPHGLTSKASTTTKAPVAAGFFDPVTSIVSVWLAAARPGKVNTASWGPSEGMKRSRESATTVPSRITRAIPACGPR